MVRYSLIAPYQKYCHQQVFPLLRRLSFYFISSLLWAPDQLYNGYLVPTIRSPSRHYLFTTNSNDNDNIRTACVHTHVHLHKQNNHLEEVLCLQVINPFSKTKSWTNTENWLIHSEVCFLLNSILNDTLVSVWCSFIPSFFVVCIRSPFKIFISHIFSKHPNIFLAIIQELLIVSEASLKTMRTLYFISLSSDPQTLCFKISLFSTYAWTNL